MLPSLLVYSTKHKILWEIPIHQYHHHDNYDDDDNDDDYDDSESEFINKFDTLKNKLVEKEMLIEKLKALNQNLTVKEREIDNKLQKARKNID